MPLKLLPYVAIALLHIAALHFEPYLVRHVSKTLLMPALAYFIYTESRLELKWLLGAIFFSWLGDVFLIRDSEGFFIMGLVSFLIAHVAYIAIFFGLGKGKNGFLKSNIWLLAPFVLFWLGANYWFALWEKAPDMLIPVLVYSGVITAMAAAALNLKGLISNRSFSFLLPGALIFMLSDMTIAINRFKFPFEQAAFCIMVTYVIAQGLIVFGVISASKEER